EWSQFRFRALERWSLIRKTRRLPCGFWVTHLGWPTSKSHPTRKPTHGTYLLIPRLATALPPDLPRAHLPDVRRDRRRLGPLAAAPLHHRGHLLRRPRRHRPLVAIPSLLQPCRLGHRYLLPVPGRAGRDDPRPRRHPDLGRR